MISDKAFPKITIVTPSFNQAQFLERTILSVINQHYPNLEYIIIDGGSTDGSVEIIKRYEKYLAYWVSEKDNGQSEAINKGFNLATGQIFAYLNSDDIYLPGAVNHIAEIFLSTKNADIVYGNALLINSINKKIGQCIALPFKLKEHLNGLFAIPQPSAFWKREVFDKVDGFNENNQTCMDGEFFARAADAKFGFYLTNKFLSAFRVHKNSKTSDTNQEHLMDYYEDQLNYINELKTANKIKVNNFYKHLYRIKYLPKKLFYSIYYIPK
jgi:glycosyltransferase involved in cell wall biosynthesis